MLLEQLGDDFVLCWIVAASCSAFLLPAVVLPFLVDRVSHGDIDAVELETMLLTRHPEEIFAAEDRRDWDDWVDLFDRTREDDGLPGLKLFGRQKPRLNDHVQGRGPGYKTFGRGMLSPFLTDKNAIK